MRLLPKTRLKLKSMEISKKTQPTTVPGQPNLVLAALLGMPAPKQYVLATLSSSVGHRRDLPSTVFRELRKRNSRLSEETIQTRTRTTSCFMWIIALLEMPPTISPKSLLVPTVFPQMQSRIAFSRSQLLEVQNRFHLCTLSEKHSRRDV